MNLQLKHPHNIPFVLFSLIGLVWLLEQQFIGKSLVTFIVGLFITLSLFGIAGLKGLFQKMKGPFWFPIFCFIMYFLIEIFYTIIAVTSTGNRYLFKHEMVNQVKYLHGLDEKIWYGVRFLFSAINEELLMIPLVLLVFILLKRTRLAWWIASLASAILFASLHFNVYSLNVWVIGLLMIGRILLNEVFRLTNSIRTPMYVHFLFDTCNLFFMML